MHVHKIYNQATTSLSLYALLWAEGYIPPASCLSHVADVGSSLVVSQKRISLISGMIQTNSKRLHWVGKKKKNQQNTRKQGPKQGRRY
jgi:hypothetical protein